MKFRIPEIHVNTVSPRMIRTELVERPLSPQQLVQLTEDNCAKS